MSRPRTRPLIESKKIYIVEVLLPTGENLVKIGFAKSNIFDRLSSISKMLGKVGNYVSFSDLPENLTDKFIKRELYNQFGILPYYKQNTSFYPLIKTPLNINTKMKNKASPGYQELYNIDFKTLVGNVESLINSFSNKTENRFAVGVSLAKLDLEKIETKVKEHDNFTGYVIHLLSNEAIAKKLITKPLTRVDVKRRTSKISKIMNVQLRQNEGEVFSKLQSLENKKQSSRFLFYLIKRDLENTQEEIEIELELEDIEYIT